MSLLVKGIDFPQPELAEMIRSNTHDSVFQSAWMEHI